jgi:hypothetical protein
MSQQVPPDDDRPFLRQDEGRIATIVSEPQLLFVLWAVHEGAFTHITDFHEAYGARFPNDAQVARLEQTGVITVTNGRIILTMFGERIAERFSLGAGKTSRAPDAAEVVPKAPAADVGGDEQPVAAMLDLAPLARRAAQELASVTSGLNRPTTPSYALELMARALQTNSNEAWTFVLEVFTPVMRTWIHRHPSYQEIMAYGEEEPIILEAFERLFEHNRGRSVELPGLQPFLHYLRVALHGAIMDRLREKANAAPALHATAEYVPVAEVTTGASTAEIWSKLESCTINERERLLIRLRWAEELAPREIMRLFPAEFASAREISRMLSNVLARYRRRYRRSTEVDH